MLSEMESKRPVVLWGSQSRICSKQHTSSMSSFHFAFQCMLHTASCLVGRLIGFYGISTFVLYLMPKSIFKQIISSISNHSV